MVADRGTNVERGNVITISLEPGYMGQLNAAISALLRVKGRVAVIQQRVWDQVNRALEERVLINYVKQIMEETLKESTIQRKARLVKSGKAIPRDAAGGTTRKARSEFVFEYGQRTGFFMNLMKTHHPFGTKRFMIRSLGRSVLGSQVMLWGIQLDDFWKGYPIYILRGATGSTTGGSGLISLSRSDLEEFQRILFFQWFLPALAAVGVR